MASTVAAPTSVAAAHERSKWTRVASLGFLLVASAMILWIAGGMIAGQAMGEELPIFGGIILAALVGAFVVRRLGTAGKIIGIVLALATLSMMPFVAPSLTAPGAFVDFSGAVMLTVGALSALGFGIASVVRRKELHAAATPGESTAMRVMLAIVALALVVSAVLNFTSRTSVDASAAAGASSVSFESFEFASTEGPITVAAGESAKLIVHNGDAFVHNLAIPALGVEPVVVNPGSEKLIEFSAQAGTYTMYCTLHADTAKTDPREAGMAATLIVE